MRKGRNVGNSRRLDRLSPRVSAPAQEEYFGATEIADTVADTAIALRRRLGDPAALGSSLLMASRISWVHGKRTAAVDFATEAAAVLESVGGEPLAFAYSTLSQLAMLASDEEQTTVYAEKTPRTAGPGPSRARAHALNNLGTAKLALRYPEGMTQLEESYRMNAQLALSADQTRAAANISWTALNWRDLPTAATWLERGLEIAYERELPTFESYLMATQAILHEQTASGRALNRSRDQSSMADRVWRCLGSSPRSS